MASFLRDNDELQMNAYCDGELDPASAIEFERRLEIDDQLRARCSQLLMLRGALRALPQHEMPRELQSRIGHAVDRELPRHRKGLRQGSWSLRALVAAAMFGAILSGSVIMAIMTLGSDNSREDIAGGVVAGHIRSLLAPQPFDIASSDRHTVKPGSRRACLHRRRSSTLLRKASF
jgi:anti-sigma factor RsiW